MLGSEWLTCTGLKHLAVKRVQRIWAVKYHTSCFGYQRRRRTQAAALVAMLLGNLIGAGLVLAKHQCASGAWANRAMNASEWLGLRPTAT